MSGTKQLPIERTIADLRQRADNLVWANSISDDPWEYESGAAPDSAYAEWVRLCSPETFLAVLDYLEVKS